MEQGEGVGERWVDSDMLPWLDGLALCPFVHSGTETEEIHCNKQVILPRRALKANKNWVLTLHRMKLSV